MHRDVKLENLMVNVVQSATDPTRVHVQVKLTDFGFTTTCNNLSLSLGSPLYMAPELVLKKKYGQGVDVWALGVFCYMLLTGSRPFPGTEKKDIFR